MQEFAKACFFPQLKKASQEGLSMSRRKSGPSKTKDRSCEKKNIKREIKKDPSCPQKKRQVICPTP